MQNSSVVAACVCVVSMLTALVIFQAGHLRYRYRWRAILNCWWKLTWLLSNNDLCAQSRGLYCTEQHALDLQSCTAVWETLQRITCWKLLICGLGISVNKVVLWLCLSHVDTSVLCYWYPHCNQTHFMFICFITETVVFSVKLNTQLLHFHNM